jgi:FMN phosphatase YigB (HAD superfamily)
MRIGIDFDRVLFDTDSFNKYLKQNLDGLKHVETPPYNEHGVYSPKIHAEMCGIDVEKIYAAMKDLRQFVYEDVEVLEELDHELVLVTRGQKEMQERKIEGAEIADKFDDVFIVEKGSKDVGNIGFLIDDQKKEIEKAGLPGFEFDREEHSLDEALRRARRHET